MPHITPQMQGSMAATSRASQPTAASVVMNMGPKMTTREEPGITMPMKQVIRQTATTVPSLPKFQEVMMAPSSSETFRSPNIEPII